MANLTLDDSHKAVLGGVSTSTSKAISVSAIPLTSANALTVAIVDGTGAQVTSFGGGTQYTDGAVPPAHPIGNTIEWSDGSNWQTVSTSKPLPVTASFSPSGTQDVNLTKVGGSSIALGQALAAASLPVVLTAAQITTLTPVTTITVTQGTAANLNATVIGTGTFAVQATLQTQTDTVMVGGVNIKEINAVTPLMGNGATGTGALRVALVSDGTGRMATVDTVTAVTTVSTLTNQSQEGGVNISLNAGAVDTGTRRVIQANGAGKTIVSTGGSAASNGNNTLVAAGTNKLKVFAFSLSTTSTTAMTCIFQSGASGTEIWRVILQAATSTNTGANLSVSPPAWLFATASATLLNLNLSSANAVHWSVSYFDEA